MTINFTDIILPFIISIISIVVIAFIAKMYVTRIYSQQVKKSQISKASNNGIIIIIGVITLLYGITFSIFLLAIGNLYVIIPLSFIFIGGFLFYWGKSNRPKEKILKKISNQTMSLMIWIGIATWIISLISQIGN